MKTGGAAPMEAQESLKGAKAAVLAKVKKALNKRRTFRFTGFYKTARVPVLKLRHNRSGIDLDLCADNVMAIRNTQLLRTYLELDPARVRPFVVAVKTWAKARNISDASQGTLSSYAHAILALNYLQVQGLLPSLQSRACLEASPYAERPRLECGHDTSFCMDARRAMQIHKGGGGGGGEGRGESRRGVDGREGKGAGGDGDGGGGLQVPPLVPSPSLGGLLHGYFHHVAHIFRGSPQTACASVRLGRVVQDRDAEVSRLREAKKPRPRWRMSIEDPFELSHDLADVLRSESKQRLVLDEFDRAARAASAGDWASVMGGPSQADQGVGKGRKGGKGAARTAGVADGKGAAAGGGVDGDTDSRNDASNRAYSEASKARRNNKGVKGGDATLLKAARKELRAAQRAAAQELRGSFAKRSTKGADSEGHTCPLCAFPRNPPGQLQGLFYNHYRKEHADACDDAGGSEAHGVPRRMFPV